MAYRLRFTLLLWLTLMLLVISAVYIHRALASGDYCADLLSWYDSGPRWHVDLLTGKVIQLSTGGPEETPAGQPVPDGKYIASTILTDRWHSLYRLEILDSSTDLISYTADDVRAAVAWSPDSQWLLYFQSLEDNEILVITRPDGSDQQTYPYSSDSQFDFFDWSPDGKTLALSRTVFSAANEQYLDLLTIPDLALDQSLELSASVRQVKWSPSADRVYLEGEAGQLLVYSLDDETWQQITIQPYPVELHLFWSPSGEYLLTQYSYSDLGFAVNIFDRGGEQAVELFLTPQDDPRVSANYYWLDDHTFLLSVVSVTDTAIMDNLNLFDLATGTQTTLIEDVSEWHISPDRQWIAAIPGYNGSVRLKLRTLPMADFHAKPAEIQLARYVSAFNWTNDGSAFVTYSSISQDSGASIDLYNANTGLHAAVDLTAEEIPDDLLRIRRASCGEL